VIQLLPLVYLSLSEPDTLDDDLVNDWAANLGDDGLWGNNALAMTGVCFLSILFCFSLI